MSYPESKWGPLKQKTGSHLEKIGRPVVLENVSGGHFEREKKNEKAPPPSFFPQRPDAKHVFFFYFALCVVKKNRKWKKRGLEIDLQLRQLYYSFFIGAFTLAGISGIQISVFASRSNSWVFTSVDIKISVIIAISIALQIARNLSIICIAADVWTLEQIILVFYILSFQPSVLIKTRARVIFRLDIRHAQFG